MGQASDDVSDDELPAVTAEVDALRERTQAIVAELERRLRDGADKAKHTFLRIKRAADIKAQIVEHPGLAIGVSTVAALALGFGVWVAMARRREARRPINRLKTRLGHYRALLAEPHRALLKQEPIVKRLVAAVLIAGATTIVRGLATMLVDRARSLPPSRHQG
jgi:ElaB/YqjD/DUF883 family membrane-anchored ribosome-binding protein